MKRGFASSLFVHGVLFAALAAFLASDGPSVRGNAGLSGATATRFDVVVATEISARPHERKITPAREGVAIPVEKLPSDVKNSQPREIDENPNAVQPAEKSSGTAATAPIGREGQGGTGDTASVDVGNANHSNRFGIYLQSIERKIQAQLGPSPYLEFDRRARLVLTITRDGRSEVKLAQTSGDRELDRRALQAAQRAAPFEAWENDLTVEVPVLFRAK